MSASTTLFDFGWDTSPFPLYYEERRIYPNPASFFSTPNPALKTSKPTMEIEMIPSAYNENQSSLTKRVPDPSLLADKRIIIFYCEVYPDGFGDSGHLVDIARPDILKLVSSRMPISIGEDQCDYQPVYVISCQRDDAVKRFIINQLKENGILKEIIPPNGLELEAYMNYTFRTYLEHILRENPHVHIMDIERPIYSLSEVQKYLPNHPHLQRQLDNACMVVRVSTNSYPVPELAKIKGLEIFVGEQGLCHYPKSYSLDEPYRPTAQDGLIAKSPIFTLMGFNEKYYNEKGLLLDPHFKIKKTTLKDKAKSLANFKDIKFVYRLLELKKVAGAPFKPITQEQAEQFLDDTLFVPAYLSEEKYNALFISILSICAQAKAYSSVAFFIGGSPVSAEDLSFYFPLLARTGISTIEWHRGEEEPEIIILSEHNGRRIRIFCHYRFEKEVCFKELYAIAQLFAGCSGDKTLECCFKNFLIPLYQTKTWKYRYSKDFTSIVGKYTKNKHVLKFHTHVSDLFYYGYPRRRKLEMIEDIAEAMDDENFLKEWGRVLLNINLHHNFYHALPDVFVKGIAYYQLCNAINKADFSRAIYYLDTYFKENEMAGLFREALMHEDYAAAKFLLEYSKDKLLILKLLRDTFFNVPDSVREKFIKLIENPNSKMPDFLMDKKEETSDLEDKQKQSSPVSEDDIAEHGFNLPCVIL